MIWPRAMLVFVSALALAVAAEVFHENVNPAIRRGQEAPV